MNQDSAELFSRFSKALTHLIRGDLSVVSSELRYLAGLVGDDEVALARKRCTAIAQTISMISSGYVTGVQEEISVEELGEAFGIDCDAHEVAVVCERARLLNCVGELQSLLGVWHGDISFDGSLKIKLSFVQQSASTDEGEYRSISAYVARNAGDGDVVRSVLVDCFFRSQGWKVQLLHSDKALSVSLTVPADCVREWQPSDSGDRHG